MNCYLCGIEITDANRTPEHIIPDAIGGAIVGWNLLCAPCNYGPASRMDAGFVRFTSYLYRMVLQARPISRTSDSLMGITELGEEIRFGPNMAMDTKVQIALPDGKIHSFTAPPADVEEKAIKRLFQFKGKYDQIDPQKMIANAVRGEARVNELVYFTNHDTKHSTAGGPDFIRGAKRIAINFYLNKDYPQHYVQSIINQIRENRLASPRAFSFYHTSYQIHELSENEISHIIKLVGDPELGLLYCYIELFNINPVLVLLNRYYYGPPIEEQYCYDVLTSTTINKPIRLPFDNRDLMLMAFDRDWNTGPQAQDAYNRTRKILENLLRAKRLIE